MENVLTIAQLRQQVLDQQRVINSLLDAPAPAPAPAPAIVAARPRPRPLIPVAVAVDPSSADPAAFDLDLEASGRGKPPSADVALAIADSDAALAFALQAQENELGSRPSRALALGQPRAPSSSASAYSSLSAPLVDHDQQLAQRLQQLEVEGAARDLAQQQQQRERQLDAGGRPESSIVDPVWGRFANERADGSPLAPCAVLCLSCCPCLVPPLCSADRQAAWRRVAASASFGLSMVQLIVLIIACSPPLFRGFAPTAINSMVGPWPDTLDLLQAKNTGRIVAFKELWRLFTPIFLHAGFIHLAANLVMQLRLGLYLEVAWGTRLFLPLYFGAGTFASLGSAVLLPASIGVGASGALMGVLGAWLAELLVGWGGPAHTATIPARAASPAASASVSAYGSPTGAGGLTAREAAAEAAQSAQAAQGQRVFQLIMCVVNIGVVVAFSFTPLIDWAAHLSGLVGGALLGGAVFGRLAGKPRLAAASAATFACLTALGLALLYSGAIAYPPQLLDFCTWEQESYQQFSLTCPR